MNILISPRRMSSYFWPAISRSESNQASSVSNRSSVRAQFLFIVSRDDSWSSRIRFFAALRTSVLSPDHEYERSQQQKRHYTDNCDLFSRRQGPSGVRVLCLVVSALNYKCRPIIRSAPALLVPHC